MIESADYRVTLTVDRARVAEMASPDGRLAPLAVATPPEFGGPEDTWSPEHLFVAAASSCLMTTFFAVADIARLEVVSYSDDAEGRLVRGEDRLYSIDRIVFRPSVVVAREADVPKAIRLLERAEAVCLIGRSMLSETCLEPKILVAEAASV